MPQLKELALAGAVMATILCPATVWARIKLITLPVRERVEVQLDNPDATLVEEERIVPLVQGENQVDFSWANTQIDGSSIVFRVIGPADGKQMDVKVLSVSYPPNEASLVWAVGASDSGSARVRISYLLGNLTKSFAYRAVASNDEKHLTLAQYMRLQNFANEEFGSTGLWAGFGKEFSKPIGINETKEMLVTRFAQIPVRKTYSCNPHEYDYLDRAQNKLRVPMHYVLKNDKADGMGGAALPAGKVRIFIEGSGRAAEAEKTTAFLGEDWGKFTPIDDEMKLYLGVAQDIVVKRTIAANEVKRITGNLYNREVTIRYEVENFKNQPVMLDLAEDLSYVRAELGSGQPKDAQWEIAGGTTLPMPPDREKSTFDRVQFNVPLPAKDKDGKAEKVVHELHLILKNEW